MRLSTRILFVSVLAMPAFASAKPKSKVVEPSTAAQPTTAARRIEGNDLFDYLGVSNTSPAFEAIRDSYVDDGDGEFGYSDDPADYAHHLLTSITLRYAESPEYESFLGVLPCGLTWGMARAAILLKLGTPATSGPEITYHFDVNKDLVLQFSTTIWGEALASVKLAYVKTVPPPSSYLKNGPTVAAAPATPATTPSVATAAATPLPASGPAAAEEEFGAVLQRVVKEYPNGFGSLKTGPANKISFTLDTFWSSTIKVKGSGEARVRKEGLARFVDGKAVYPEYWSNVLFKGKSSFPEAKAAYEEYIRQIEVASLPCGSVKSETERIDDGRFNGQNTRWRPTGKDPLYAGMVLSLYFWLDTKMDIWEIEFRIAGIPPGALTKKPAATVTKEPTTKLKLINKSEREIEEIYVYFSTLGARFGPNLIPDEKLIKKGESITLTGVPCGCPCGDFDIKLVMLYAETPSCIIRNNHLCGETKTFTLTEKMAQDACGDVE